MYWIGTIKDAVFSLALIVTCGFLATRGASGLIDREENKRTHTIWLLVIFFVLMTVAQKVIIPKMSTLLAGGNTIETKVSKPPVVTAIKQNPPEKPQKIAKTNQDQQRNIELTNAERHAGDAMFDAIHAGDIPKMNALIAQGGNINAPNYLGWTPMYSVVINGRKDILLLMLEKGADINAKNRDGDTPLFPSASSGRKEIAELLLAKGANVNVANNNGRTPLHVAVDQGQEDMVALLLAHGATVDAKLDDGITPLHLAAKQDNKAIVEALLSCGANPNARTAENPQARYHFRENWTPLHFSSEEGKQEVVELLLAKGADINAQDQDGLTPLMRALYGKHGAIAEALIVQGADVKIRSKSGETALHIAASYGTIGLVKQLLNKGADVNAETNNGGSALDRATFNRVDDIAALLRSSGALVELFRCETSNGSSTTTTLWHGKCPFPSDVRTLVPQKTPKPKISVANTNPTKTEDVNSSLPPRSGHAEVIRCTSPDGKSTTIQRGKCTSPSDIETQLTIVKPLLKRSPSNTELIKCTSRDGKNVSIQRGNCVSPDDYQQLL